MSKIKVNLKWNKNEILYLIFFLFFSLFRKSPDFKECVLNFTSTIDDCLDDGEKDSKKILLSVTEALLSFVCHDEGDRIARNNYFIIL